MKNKILENLYQGYIDGPEYKTISASYDVKRAFTDVHDCLFSNMNQKKNKKRQKAKEHLFDLIISYGYESEKNGFIMGFSYALRLMLFGMDILDTNIYSYGTPKDD